MKKMRKRKKNDTNNNKEGDSKVNKINRKYKILVDTFQDVETAEADFCQFSMEKGARKGFKTVEEY